MQVQQPQDYLSCIEPEEVQVALTHSLCETNCSILSQDVCSAPQVGANFDLHACVLYESLSYSKSKSWQQSCVLKGSLPGLVLREAAQLQDVEHEVSSIDVLHDKEEMIPGLEA